MTNRKRFPRGIALAFLAAAIVLAASACPAPATCSNDACPSGTACAADGTCAPVANEGEGAPGEGEGAVGEGEGAVGEGEGAVGEGEGEGEGAPLVLPTFSADGEDDLTVAAGQTLSFTVVLSDAQLPCTLNGADVDATALTATLQVPTKSTTPDAFAVTLACANVTLPPVTFRVLIEGVTVAGLPVTGAPVDVTVQAPSADTCTIGDVSFAPSSPYAEPATSTAIESVTCQAPDGGAATATFLLPVQIQIVHPIADATGVHFDVIGDDATCDNAVGVDGTFTIGAPANASGIVATPIVCHAANDAGDDASTTLNVLYGDLDATSYAALQPGAVQLVAGSIDLTGAASVDDQGIIAVGGDFTIANTAATSVSLASLQAVGGALTIAGDGALGAIDLGALTKAGALDVENNPFLTSLSLPALAAVSGNFAVSNNATGGAQLGLSLGALASVDGSVTFLDNAGLATDAATSVVTQVEDAGFGIAGAVVIQGNGP